MCNLSEEQMDELALKVVEKLTNRGVKWTVRIVLGIVGLIFLWALKDMYDYIKEAIIIVKDTIIIQ